jgi:hypothetical protein
MSHIARNYVYEVKVPAGGLKNSIPKVTTAQIEEYRRNIAKYLSRKSPLCDIRAEEVQHGNQKPVQNS